MAQQNEQSHSLDPATVPAKRKRGRPRKEDAPGFVERKGGLFSVICNLLCLGAEPSGRTRRRCNPPPTTTSQDLVGQPVSGILDGVFDAGFLITVRVSNNGSILKGMVFDSRLSVPITAANDVAPQIKMSKRDEIPIPSVPISAEPLQRRDPPVLSRIANRILSNDGSVRSKGSEAVISGVQLTVSKEAIKVGGDQMQGLTGAPKLDSTSKTSLDNKTASDLKADSATQMSPRPPLSESDTKEEKLHDDSGQTKTSIPAAATSSANSEILQEIKTNFVVNGSTQMPSGDAAWTILQSGT